MVTVRSGGRRRLKRRSDSRNKRTRKRFFAPVEFVAPRKVAK